jgi:hypothetical protein
MIKEKSAPDEQVLTPEEIKARRTEITKFYKDQLPHLKVQAEYERLMTEIEEYRAKRLQAQAFLANAYETMENDEEAKTQEKPTDK